MAASHGWFNRLKARTNLHDVKVSREAASADAIAAQEFPATLREIIDEGASLPQQVFNVSETGLTNEDLMELEAQQKDEESQEEDVTEEPKRCTTQEMEGDFHYLKRHCSVLRHKTPM